MDQATCQTNYLRGILPLPQERYSMKRIAKINKISVAVIPMAARFAIPPKIAKNFQIVGDMGNTENWKAKILLANSASEEQKKGQWDEVGYVMISLDSNLIIPIARADEHQTGYELLHDYYFAKNLVPVEKYVSVWTSGNNYIYPRSANDQLKALIKFRQYGGKNNVLEGASENRAYRSTIDDFIQGKGSTLVDKAQLSPLGKFVMSSLESIINAWNAKDNKIFSMAYNFLKWIDINSLPMSKAFDFSNDEIKKIMDGLLQAEANQDFSAVADVFFRLRGIKNKMHNKIRQAIKKKESGYDYEKEELVNFWGNLEVANLEMNKLSNL